MVQIAINQGLDKIMSLLKRNLSNSVKLLMICSGFECYAPHSANRAAIYYAIECVKNLHKLERRLSLKDDGRCTALCASLTVGLAAKLAEWFSGSR
jgi:hypothetical protein